MLRSFKDARGLLQRLRADKDGVVSFEYVIVAICIVAAVAAAFGTTASGGIGAALVTGIGDLTTQFATAIAG